MAAAGVGGDKCGRTEVGMVWNSSITSESASYEGVHGMEECCRRCGEDTRCHGVTVHVAAPAGEPWCYWFGADVVIGGGLSEAADSSGWVSAWGIPESEMPVNTAQQPGFELAQAKLRDLAALDKIAHANTKPQKTHRAAGRYTSRPQLGARRLGGSSLRSDAYYELVASRQPEVFDGLAYGSGPQASVWTATAPPRLVDGAMAWPLGLPQHVLEIVSDPILIPDAYTHAYWVKWGANDNFRTLARSVPHDHDVLVNTASNALGFYSNRIDQFRDSGAEVVAGEWMFVATTGVADSPGSASGMNTMYTGTRTSPTAVTPVTINRVSSGNDLWRFGLGSQEPGDMAVMLGIPRALTADEVQQLYCDTWPWEAEGLAPGCQLQPPRDLARLDIDADDQTGDGYIHDTGPLGTLWGQAPVEQFDGVNVFDFNGNPRHDTMINTIVTVPDTYTHAYWVRWSSAHTNFRTLLPHYYDHDVLLYAGTPDLGFYSNRRDGFHHVSAFDAAALCIEPNVRKLVVLLASQAGTAVPNDWCFVVAVGVASFPGFDIGESQYYVGTKTQGVQRAPNTVPRVGSGTVYERLGYPGQGPGYIHMVLGFDIALSEDSIRALYCDTWPFADPPPETECALLDCDGDGVADEDDNCVDAPNADQADEDGDGLGDACDSCAQDPLNDADGDGICAHDEIVGCTQLSACNYDASATDSGNCNLPGTCGCDGDQAAGPHPDPHRDCDGVCLSDVDADDLCDEADPCPLDAENDGDGDGVCESDDAFPLDGTETTDSDGDGVGDNGDICWGTDASGDPDNDLICSDIDNCPSVPNAPIHAPGEPFPGQQVDADGDGQGDACDLDRDGDGVANVEDAWPDDPSRAHDADRDGVEDSNDQCVGDDEAGDSDLDGVCNDLDACLGTDAVGDSDGDGVCDDRDSCVGDDATGDTDGDGVCNDLDACEGDDASGDLDGDGICDSDDNDIDGDSIPNGVDAFPLNPLEAHDLDGDRIGDNSDPDIDGDGHVNDLDAFPRDPLEWVDSDGSGLGDNADPDDDNDGVPDAVDAFPTDPQENTDTDADGIGDNADPDIDGDDYVNDQDAFPFDPTAWDPTCSPGCAPDASCSFAYQCESDVCTEGRCQAATCTDGVQNGDEAVGVDFGGSCVPACAPACPTDAACFAAEHCESRVCGAELSCVAATCTDGVRNGGEVDVDAGGPCPPRECAADATEADGVRLMESLNRLVRRSDTCLPEHEYCSGRPHYVEADGTAWYLMPTVPNEFLCVDEQA